MFIEADDTSIKVEILFTQDDKGVQILKHYLEIDSGDDFDSAFTVLPYDGVSETYEITLTSPPRTIFRIRSRA